MNKILKTIGIGIAYLVGLLLFVILSFFADYFIFVGLIASFVGFLYFANGYLSLADLMYLGLGTTRLALYQRFMKRVIGGLIVVLISFLYLELVWVWVKETRNWMDGFNYLLVWSLVVFIFLMSQLGMIFRLFNLPSFLVFASGTILFVASCILVIYQEYFILINSIISFASILLAIYVEKKMKKVRMDKR